MWFTNYNSIGRITTSGVMTSYADPSIGGSYSITAGSDGALMLVTAVAAAASRTVRSI